MFAAGIDIGSRTVKIVLLNDSNIERWAVADTASHPLDTAQTLMRGMPACPVIATGYGRDAAEAMLGIKTVTEIKAHAHGARFFYPAASAVIDIGGQDLKAIALDESGCVKKFEMNDRCAAGTGKFLEIMAQKLGYALDEFGDAARAGSDSVKINSTCTVFAESEVIGLVNKNIPRQDIARALHRSVAAKIAPMYRRVCSDKHCVVLSGGGALNSCLVELLKKEIGTGIALAENPRIIGALGAALLARQSA